MKYKHWFSITLTGFFGVMAFGAAMANEVQYVVNEPTTIVYQIAYQNAGQQPVLGERQTIAVVQTATLPIDLKGYQRAGVVTDKVDGHELPANAKQFGAEVSCTMATNKNEPTGKIAVTIKPHEIDCGHTF